MEYVSIGSTPHEESCAQVGDPDYAQKAKAECTRFMEHVRKHYPEPAGGYLKIKGFSHDFGTYYEVVAVYNDCDEEAANWAFSVEADEKGVLHRWE
jgi:hypothetical protein